MKRDLSERLKIPADLTKGDLLLNLTGNHQVYIENYKGIVEYTEHAVLIAGKHCQMHLKGKHLAITYYTDDEMKIEGQFETITFLK